MVSASPSGNSAQIHKSTPSSAEARLNRTNTASSQRRKRKRRDDDEEGRPEQIPKLNAGQSSSPFACPFYLYDRHEWHNCLRNYTLNRIVDVRLHLQRAHTLALQCPICGEEFIEDSAGRHSAEDRLSAHVQLRTCRLLLSPPPARHGITKDQVEAVRAIATRRNGRRASDSAAEKWFEIWDIIFPATPRPLSPYINENPDVQRIRDMNDNIFTGEQWRELTLPTRGSSPSLQNASRNTIMTIAGRLLAIYRRMSQRDSDHVASPSEEIPVAPHQGQAEEQAYDQQKGRSTSSTGKQATSKRNDSVASPSEEISVAPHQSRAKERAYDQQRRRSISSMGKRTLTERSDSDHEDTPHCPDFYRAGSSAWRLEGRVGDQDSSFRPDLPPKMDEVLEPPEPEGAEILAKDSPFYNLTAMEVDLP